MTTLLEINVYLARTKWYILHLSLAAVGSTSACDAGQFANFKLRNISVHNFGSVVITNLLIDVRYHLYDTAAIYVNATLSVNLISQVVINQSVINDMHYTCMDACMHIYIHTYIHTYIDAPSHTFQTNLLKCVLPRAFAISVACTLAETDIRSKDASRRSQMETCLS